MRSSECSSEVLIAFIEDARDTMRLPISIVEVLLNILLGTSQPTLTNLVGDVLEKVNSLPYARAGV